MVVSGVILVAFIESLVLNYIFALVHFWGEGGNVNICSLDKKWGAQKRAHNGSNNIRGCETSRKKLVPLKQIGNIITMQPSNSKNLLCK